MEYHSIHSHIIPILSLPFQRRIFTEIFGEKSFWADRKFQASSMRCLNDTNLESFRSIFWAQIKFWSYNLIKNIPSFSISIGEGGISEPSKRWTEGCAEEIDPLGFPITKKKYGDTWRIILKWGRDMISLVPNHWRSLRWSYGSSGVYLEDHLI